KRKRKPREQTPRFSRCSRGPSNIRMVGDCGRRVNGRTAGPPCAYVRFDIFVVSMKKTRLEAAGWKVGTAAEFLGLNKQEAAFVEMKLALARCLHALRIRRRLSQRRVAALVGSCQARVAEMESGASSGSIDLLLRSSL